MSDNCGMEWTDAEGNTAENVVEWVDAQGVKRQTNIMEWTDAAGNSWDNQPASMPDGLAFIGINVRSIYNPEKLLNNCAFVTMSYLLGVTAADLCNHVGIRPVPGAPGVSLDTVLQALGRLGVAWSAVRYSTTVRVAQVLRERRVRGVPPGRVTRPTGWPSHVGVAYRRANGTGHVVVGTALGGAGYTRYMDYQQSSKGQDVSADVRASRIHMIFAVDRQLTKSAVFASAIAAVEGKP